MAVRLLRGRAVALPWPTATDGPSSGSVAALACPAVPPPARPGGVLRHCGAPGPVDERPTASHPFSKGWVCAGTRASSTSPYTLSISRLTNRWTSVVPGSGIRLSVRARLTSALRMPTLTSCKVNWFAPILFAYCGRCRLSIASTF